MTTPARSPGRDAWLLTLAALLLQGCGVGYVVNSSLHQMELLASRQPVEALRRQCALTPDQTRALDLIADVKHFGLEIGLSGSANYDTLAVGWDHTIWNLSASEPLSFNPETWWFPIVGTVPYLGFFTEEEARQQQDALAARGLDVYVRTAGAYSTLGWFEDPILIPMLDWEPYDLINTILHELTHATVWIPGSVAFNESFASFVGDVATFRYLADRHGQLSEPYRQAQALVEDRERWRAMLKELYDELKALYEDSTLDDPAKLARKAEAFASLEGRVAAAGFHDPELYRQAVVRRRWNNALLIQFNTYNNNRQAFERLLERHHGDLPAFMRDVARLVREADDPFEALEQAAGG